MTSRSTWPRDRWLDAIWDCPDVKPNERAVAYAYARYAGNGDLTWCTWEELKRRTGIRSRDALSRAIGGLKAAGWLEEREPPRQHYSARYLLTTPQQSVKRTPGEVQQSGKRTADEMPSSPFDETSSPFPETSSPFNGPDLSNTELRTQISDGGTLPPDPLRHDPPQAPGRTEEQLPDRRTGTEHNSSREPNPPPARTGTRARPLLAVVQEPP